MTGLARLTIPVPGNGHNAMMKLESCVRRRDPIRPLEARASDPGPARRRRIRCELNQISRRLNSSSGLPCSDSELGSGEPGEVLHLKVRSDEEAEFPFARPGIDQFSLLTTPVGLRLVLLSQTGYRS